MIDGEHYIRGLSDAELGKFAGLNRNMYTKAELQIADDELAKRRRDRAARAAAKAAPHAPAEHAGMPPASTPEPPIAPEPLVSAPPKPLETVQPQAEPPKQPGAKSRPAKSPAAKTDWSAMDGEAYMHCTFCDAKVRLDAAFCTKCGKRIAIDDAIEDTHPYSPWSDKLGGSCCMSDFSEDDMWDRCCNPRI